MSDVPSDDCSEIGDAMSPEVPIPLSCLERSKVCRKKLYFEDVSQMLDSRTDNEDRSKDKVSRSGAGRLETSVSERVSSSRLNTIARGYNGGGGVTKTSSQNKGRVAANLKGPSKTPPA